MGRTRLHDEATAAALLDAAERILAADGVDGLTVRRVADDLGTTTRAVYSSLGSKQALLARLGVRAFDLLGARVAALPVTDDPVRDLVAAGVDGFRGFVLAHPALFQVGFQPLPVPREFRMQVVPSAEHALGALIERVGHLERVRGIGGRDVREAALEFHCLCEGLTGCELRGVLGDRTAAERTWRSALGALVRGWSVSG